MRKVHLAAHAVLLGTLASAGCIPMLPHGKPRAPNRSLPASYGGQTDTTNTAQRKWSELFTDPKLNVLIDTALKNNQELNLLTLEVDIAQNEILTRKGEFLPRLDFEVGAGIEKVGKYTSQGASDEAHGVAEHLPSFAFGFHFSWEIDIWSKLRNATKAAVLRYLSTNEGRKFAVTTLVRELSSSYYELLALDAQLGVVEQNIELQNGALDMVRLEKQAAKVTELAVQRFEAEVLKTQSRQYAIRQRIVETENRINFLVGRLPQHVDRSTERFTDLVPASVHTGLPAELLENRPDVKQGELALAAAELDVKVAKASFYPTLAINADIGYQSFDFLKVVSTPASLAYSLLGGVVAPLFNRKQLTATYFTSSSKQMQAVWKYERAIMSGYSEVIKQVSMIDNLAKSFALQAQQVEKLTHATEISSRLFAAARADYMEVLLTRRDALEAQMELIESKQQQLVAAVGLYQALGGGWR